MSAPASTGLRSAVSSLTTQSAPRPRARPCAAGLAALALALAAGGFLAGAGWQLARPEAPDADTLTRGAWAVLTLAGGLGLVVARAWRRLEMRCARTAEPRGRWQGQGQGQAAAVVAVVTAVCALACAAGWLHTGRLARERIDAVLPHALEGRDLELTGTVAALPQRLSNGVRFRFEPERAVLDGQPLRVDGQDLAGGLPTLAGGLNGSGAAASRSAVVSALPADRVPAVVSLGWYAPWGSPVDAESVRSLPQAALRAGQRWRFTVRLRRPHGNLNPGGFDLELFLFEQGVRAVGHVRGGPLAPVLLEDTARHPVERARQAVRDALFDAVPDRRAAGVLAALVVGDQSAITRDDWALFRATGIAHLVSISGLHVTMFAWLAGRALAAAWRRSPRAMRWRPAPVAGRWGGWSAAAAYALLAGWGVPAQRTVGMLGVVCGLASLGARWPWPMVLLAAAVLVTAMDPWALLQPGFWLSFAAVGLLMASGSPGDGALPTGRRDGEVPRPGADHRAPGGPAPGPAINAGRVGPDAAMPSHAGAPAVTGRVPAPFTPPSVHARALAAAGAAEGARHVVALARDGLRAQVVATIGLAPLTLVFFQQLSLVGLLANLVAIPLITLWVTPLALLGVAVPGLWAAAAWSVGVLNGALTWLAQWPMAVWPVPVAPLWAQASGLFAALLAVAPLPWRLRWLALPLVLPLLWPPLDRPPPGRFHLVAADVGQGTAVLLRTHRHLLVFDTGPSFGPDNDAGQQWLLPLLQARGERRIDRLVLSHRDQDHVGGAGSLLRALPVGEVMSSLEADHPLRAGPVPHRPCHAGDHWQWDGVRFEVLHPGAGDDGRKLKSNARSCVLRVVATGDGGGSVLLTGDIEREQEQRLVAERGPSGLRVSVLMTPHHGSKTSSSAAFLDATQATVAVVQAGYRNRYGHPAPSVLARHVERGMRVVESTRCGAWTWRGDAAVAEAHCERDVGLRHWHDRPPTPEAPQSPTPTPAQAAPPAAPLAADPSATPTPAPASSAGSPAASAPVTAPPSGPPSQAPATAEAQITRTPKPPGHR